MKSISFRLNGEELDRLDQLVTESDHFDQRSQAIRYAVRVLLQQYTDPDDNGGFRVRSTPTKRERAATIVDYLESELGAQNVSWDVIRDVEVGEE